MELYQKRPLCFFILLFTLALILVRLLAVHLPASKKPEKLQPQAGSTEVSLSGGVTDTPKGISQEKGQSESKGLPPDAVVRLRGRIVKKEAKDGRQIIYLEQVKFSAESADILKKQNQFHMVKQISGQGVVCYLKETQDGEPKKEEPLLLGMQLTLSGRLSEFSSAENDGQFDAKSYYHLLGCEAMLTGACVLQRGTSYDRLGEALFRYKQRLQTFLEASMTAEDASVLSAMLLGEKSSMEPEIKSLYQKNGIAHILAISGLHISLLGMGLYRLFRKLFVPAPLCSILGMAVVLLYGKMVGAQSALFRASCMFILFLLSDLLSQSYDMITAMAFSAFLLLLKQPDSLYSAGFLLSYLAVFGIGIVYPILEGHLNVWMDSRSCVRKKKRAAAKIAECGSEIGNKILQKALAALCGSLSIQLVTLPVILWYYYEMPLYAVFLNLIVVPCLGIALFSGAVGAVLYQAAPLWITHLVLALYEWLCRFTLTLPLHTVRTGRPELWQVILYYLLLTIWLLILSKKEKNRDENGRNENSGEMKTSAEDIKQTAVQGKDRRRAGNRIQRKRKDKKASERRRQAESVKAFAEKLIPVFMLPVLLMPVKNCDKVTFLSVGQGDCSIVQTKQGNCFLIDGGSSDEKKTGQYRLIPYLKYNGIKKVDLIFISHAHADHTSALLELLALGESEEMGVGGLVLSRLAKEDAKYDTIRAAAERAGVPVYYLSPLQTLQAKRVRFVCVSPQLAPGQDGEPAVSEITDENDESMVLYVRLQDAGFLFTGDLTSEWDERLADRIQQADAGRVNVLKVSHHGARTSTSEAFLERISPAAAVISSGAGNSYGHPHEETLERLAAANAKVFRTDEYGQITMRVKKGRVVVEMFGD